MRMNTQTDPRWANDIMVDPPWQDKPDYIKDWFCLGTSLANVVQLIIGHEFTPADMNELLKKKKGYAYLRIGDTVTRGQESFLLYDVIEKQFCIRIKNVPVKEYAKRPNKYYIARFEVHYTINGKKRAVNHYSNVMTEIIIHSRRYFEIFDVYTGQTIILPTSEISLLKQVTL
jgi:hypothetical protein